MELKLRPIGTVRRLPGGESVLELDATCAAGLYGARPGDQLEVFYWMHQLSPGDRKRLKVHPRGDRSRPLKGVFALRSPSRPNPIGATVVRLERIEGNRARVAGLDARDGSPIIDIKIARKAEKSGVPGR